MKTLRTCGMYAQPVRFSVPHLMEMKDAPYLPGRFRNPTQRAVKFSHFQRCLSLHFD